MALVFEGTTACRQALARQCYIARIFRKRHRSTRESTRAYYDAGTNVLAPFSSRFIVVSVLNKKSTTPVSKRNTHPVYAPKDATFNFLIYLSLTDHLGVVELVVWDKQMLEGMSRQGLHT